MIHLLHSVNLYPFAPRVTATHGAGSETANMPSVRLMDANWKSSKTLGTSEWTLHISRATKPQIIAIVIAIAGMM